MSNEVHQANEESKQPMDWPDTLTTPQESDLATLTHSIIEWRRLKEENDSRKLQVRETGVKMKALEEIIVRVMKSHNIGALDLKNSGGRVFFKTKKSQGSVGQKNMVKLIGDYLKSADEATKLMEYVHAQRPVVVKESIHYEKA
jgi:hypothetical protein